MTKHEELVEEIEALLYDGERLGVLGRIEMESGDLLSDQVATILGLEKAPSGILIALRKAGK